MGEMTIYNNTRANAEIASVEFASSGAGQFAFFHLRSEADEETVRQWLKASGFEVAAKTQGAPPILVVKGAKAPTEMFALLQARGDGFSAYVPPKKFQPWKWRGTFSLLGQMCELTSTVTAHHQGSRTKGDNLAYFTYATANLTAAMMEILFGANVEPDKHRLHALKSQANEMLRPYLPQGTELPAPEAKLNPESDRPKSVGQQAHDFVRRYAVYIETGLRYFAAFSLAFPIAHIGRAMKHLRTGDVGKALKGAVNENPFTLATGLAIVVGKAVTLCSKTPDPYDPKPRSALDQFRENGTFKLGTIIEGFGTIPMVYNGFKPRLVNGQMHSNPIAGVGNSLFLAGYTARYFAPFGVRKLDMPELQAHLVEGLSKVPHAQLPQLTADITANVVRQTTDQEKAPEFGQLYVKLLDGLPQARSTAATEPPPRETSFAQESLKRKAAGIAAELAI